MIEIKHLQKAYDNTTPLKDICATINKGDVIAVIGPSGTGKSTFIRCINGLETPTSGEIWVNGKNITEKGFNLTEVRQKMGMVFQGFNLFHHMTVIENVMIGPMEVLKKSKQEAYDTAMQLLRQVGMADKALSYPNTLSGGQKQRVAIARTLAMEPEIILLDEPTSALDPKMVKEVQAVIRNLTKQNLTMIIVTHEMSFAREIANRVFYLDEGIIYEEGTPTEIFQHPQKEKTLRFVKQYHTYEQEIASKDFDFIGFIAGVEEFGRQCHLAQKTILRTQAVFEELCVQILLPQLPEEIHMHVSLEHFFEGEEALAVRMKYNGPAFNPQSTKNKLALQIVESNAKSITYQKTENSDLTNEVTVIIK